MAKNNFLLLSMEDDQINKVANVVSNKTSKKILDVLAEKDHTESEISKQLKLPISTVHYNLKQLIDAGLVSADEYHYSEKGREVLHYKLANKYIIIAPQKKKGLKTILKNILPVALVTIGIAAVIEFTKRFFNPGQQLLASSPGTFNIQEESARTIMDTADALPDAAMKTVSVLSENVSNVSAMGNEVITQPMLIAQSSEPNIAIWFLIGSFTAIAIFSIVSFIRSRK